MEYYSVIKKNVILPLAATWMDLENIILGEANQTKTNIIHYHMYVESKNNTNESLYKTETGSQIQKTNFWLPKGKGTGVGQTGSIGLADTSEVKSSHSVMSDSFQPHGLQPTRLLCPWDFPGKSTGVGFHFLLQRHRHKLPYIKQISNKDLLCSTGNYIQHLIIYNGKYSKIYMYIPCITESLLLDT